METELDFHLFSCLCSARILQKLLHHAKRRQSDSNTSFFSLCDIALCTCFFNRNRCSRKDVLLETLMTLGEAFAFVMKSNLRHASNNAREKRQMKCIDLFAQRKYGFWEQFCGTMLRTNSFRATLRLHCFLI
jgi:hypothetical protein